MSSSEPTRRRRFRIDRVAGLATPISLGGQLVVFLAVCGVSDRVMNLRAGHVGDAPSCAYTGWCSTNGHRACSSTKFGATLRAVGVDKRRSDGAIYAVTLTATL